MLWLLLQAVVSGIATGCVYGLVALSLVLIYKATDIVNFGGGEIVMVGAYVGLLCVAYFGIGYVPTFVVVVAATFALGTVFDRVVLHRIGGRRLFAAHVELVPFVVATIALSFVLKGAVRVVPYTEEVRRLPSLMSGPPLFIGEVVVQRQDLAVIGAAVVLMGLLTAFFRFTWTGRALRATSQNPYAAAISGIPVRRMRMLVWGISSALAGIAGLLLAPKLLLTPEMGSVVMLAFAAAAIGGFTSLPGCVVGGVLLGIVQNLVGVFVSANAITVTPFVVIMLVLVLMPQGLFGETNPMKKV